MLVLLTKEQIRALYGFKANEEVVAFGARIKQPKHALPNRREFTLVDYGSKEAEEHYDRLMKTPSKPVARVIESEATEIL